jgi:hypothetical protein
MSAPYQRLVNKSPTEGSKQAFRLSTTRRSALLAHLQSSDEPSCGIDTARNSRIDYFRAFLFAYFASRAAFSSSSDLGAAAAAFTSALAFAALTASARSAFFAAALSALALARCSPAAARSAASFLSTGGLARSCSSAVFFASAAWPARSWKLLL